MTDFTELNEKPVHLFPSIDDLQQAIDPKSKYFAKIYLVSAFYQVPLLEETQPLATFFLPWGHHFFMRSPMGLAPGRDFACNEIDKAIKDIKDTPKCINNGFCEDKGTGPEALTVNVDKVLKSF